MRHEASFARVERRLNSRETMQLDESGCFVIPNPWDPGSARVLAQLGFKALATTSSGFAWSIGRPDNGVSINDPIVALPRCTVSRYGDAPRHWW